MYFVNTVRIHTMRHLDELRQIDEKISKLNGRRGDFTQGYFDSQMKPLGEERAAAVEAGKKDIDSLLDAYKSEVIDRYTPSGENLTPDAAILTSGMKLDKTDLERIFDKNEGNMTMQRLVSEYASQHGIKDFNRVYFPEQARISAAENLAGYAKGALENGWRAEFITNDDYYSRIQADAIRGE